MALALATTPVQLVSRKQVRVAFWKTKALAELTEVAFWNLVTF